MPSTGQFMEQLLIQRLVRVLGPHRHEDVAANKLVNHLAVRRLAGEDDVLLLVLDHHALNLPVYVPGLKIEIENNYSTVKKQKPNFITAYLDRIIPPRLQVVASIQIHLHDPVVGHSQQLLLLMSIELDDKQRHSKLGQTLPRLYKLHFSVHLWQVLDIGVCLEDPLH